MSEEHINLLKRQIEKLNERNFDLKAWKTHTILLLSAIFGEDNPKVREIGKLDYEYNSWTLRDTSGHNTYLEGCKKLGKEILEAAIEEIQLFGIPERESKPSELKPLTFILDAFHDEMKGSQYRQMLEILKSNLSQEDKHRKLYALLGELNVETTRSILLHILLNEQFLNNLPEN